MKVNFSIDKILNAAFTNHINRFCFPQTGTLNDLDNSAFSSPFPQLQPSGAGMRNNIAADGFLLIAHEGG